MPPPPSPVSTGASLLHAHAVPSLHITPTYIHLLEIYLKPSLAFCPHKEGESPQCSCVNTFMSPQHEQYTNTHTHTQPGALYVTMSLTLLLLAKVSSGVCVIVFMYVSGGRSTQDPDCQYNNIKIQVLHLKLYGTKVL